MAKIAGSDFGEATWREDNGGRSLAKKACGENGGKKVIRSPPISGRSWTERILATPAYVELC